MKINAGPSGREVISLQKSGFFAILLIVGGAKRVSARRHHQDLCCLREWTAVMSCIPLNGTIIIGANFIISRHQRCRRDLLSTAPAV
jgi:hypothetical protein